MDDALRRRLMPALTLEVEPSTLDRIVGVNVEEARSFVRRFGGATTCSFSQLVAAAWLSVPDHSDPQIWPAVAAAIDDFLTAYCDPAPGTTLPVDDVEPMLIVGSTGAAVLSRRASIDYPDDDDAGAEPIGRPSSVGPLLPMVIAMLEAVDRARQR